MSDGHSNSILHGTRGFVVPKKLPPKYIYKRYRQKIVLLFEFFWERKLVVAAIHSFIYYLLYLYSSDVWQTCMWPKLEFVTMEHVAMDPTGTAAMTMQHVGRHLHVRLPNGTRALDSSSVVTGTCTRRTSESDRVVSDEAASAACRIIFYTLQNTNWCDAS